MNNIPVIHMSSVTKKYYIGEPNELQILFDIALDINEGEFVSIVGASGSGKSTLMNIIGLLDRPTDGSYMLNGTDTKVLDDIQLSRIRNKEIGFVFQNFNLIPKITALKNVELPLLYAGVSQKKRTERAMELIELVGMGDRYTHDPSQLSGGQKQRVAIARAMANNPSIILADEPTGALDTKTGRMVMDLFHRLHKEEGKTIVLITHSPELASETDRMITISDGRIIADADRTSYNADEAAAELEVSDPEGKEAEGE
jgi:putative ABC transport system ATP-binding protein